MHDDIYFPKERGHILTLPRENKPMSDVQFSGQLLDFRLILPLHRARADDEKTHIASTLFQDSRSPEKIVNTLARNNPPDARTHRRSSRDSEFLTKRTGLKHSFGARRNDDAVRDHFNFLFVHSLRKEPVSTRVAIR